MYLCTTTSVSALFCVYFDKASHFITSKCITELMIFMCRCIYVGVICHTPVPRFYCVHKFHYHFYCVHDNVLHHVLCIWWYYVLLYFVRNDENKDDQSSINISLCESVFHYDDRGMDRIWDPPNLIIKSRENIFVPICILTIYLLYISQYLTCRDRG